MQGFLFFVCHYSKFSLFSNIEIREPEFRVLPGLSLIETYKKYFWSTAFEFDDETEHEEFTT